MFFAVWYIFISNFEKFVLIKMLIFPHEFIPLIFHVLYEVVAKYSRLCKRQENSNEWS